MTTPNGTVGSHVKVIAPGTFYGFTGTIVRIMQSSARSQRWIWIVFDDHPWQKPGIDWAFSAWELETA